MVSEDDYHALRAAWLRARHNGARVGITQRGELFELKGNDPAGQYVTQLAGARQVAEYLDTLTRSSGGGDT